MCTMLIFALFVSFVAADPLILKLNSYRSGGIYIPDNVEDGAKLFVASNDPPAFLRNITVTTGSTTITLDTLADYNTDGTPKYLNISGNLELRTLNDVSTTQELNGFIYVTTYQQAHDTTFAVYVVNGPQTISRDGMKTTTVVLNTQLISDSNDIDKPQKTTYVTNIQQSSNTNLYFMWGIPASNWYDVNDNQFFTNPVNIDNRFDNGTLMNTTRVFFDHVEPLQIGLDYWYFFAMGPVNIDVDSKYVSEHNYTTTSVNTTGIIVNNWLYKDHQVNFLLDETRNRTVGTLISAFPNHDVTFLLDSSTSIVSITTDSNLVMAQSITYFQAHRLLINSSNILPGTFYCQYFGFSTELLSVTSAPNPTTVSTTSTQSTVVSTTTVASTTKISKTFSNFFAPFLGLLISHLL